jgi:hypothetical protein
MVTVSMAIAPTVKERISEERALCIHSRDPSVLFFAVRTCMNAAEAPIYHPAISTQIDEIDGASCARRARRPPPKPHASDTRKDLVWTVRLSRLSLDSTIPRTLVHAGPLSRIMFLYDRRRQARSSTSPSASPALYSHLLLRTSKLAEQIERV